MDVAALVLTDGDGVSAWGRLVRDDRGDWFEPPLPRTLVLFKDPPVRPPWRGAVPVTGADFDDVEDRRERDGMLEGWATLTGTWSAGELRAERKEAGGPAEADRFPSWDVPPCPPPDGGWPRGRGADENIDVDMGDLEDTGAAVAVTVFRPARSRPVLVVAAADADAVEAQLRPQLGARLCVVESRWTRSDVCAVRDHLSGHWDEWNLYQCGVVNTSDGQARVTASMTRLLPEIASWASPLPAGILALSPWLAPAAR
jgi:hypothetical protein